MLEGSTLFQNLKRWSSYLVWLAMLIAVAVATGWLLNVSLLIRPARDVVPMNLTVSILFVLVAGGFHILRREKPHPYANAGMLMATIGFTVGLVHFVDYMFALGLKIDQFVVPQQFRDASHEFYSRMAPSTAFNFMLMSLALWALHRRRTLLLQLLALAVLSISWFSILGYLYRVPEFYRDLPYLPMAMQAAFCFHLLGLALLLIFAEQGFMKEFTGGYEGSRLARWLVPTALAVPVILGYLRLWTHWLNMFSTEFGVAMLVLSITVVFISVVFISVAAVNRRDVDRRRVEKDLQMAYEEVQAANEEVAALNEELTTSNDQLYLKNSQLTDMNQQLQEAYETIREQAAVILKQKDEQLNRVLEASEDIIWSFDLSGAGEHYLSRSVEKIFATPYDRLLENREFWQQGVLPEDQPLIQSCLATLRHARKAEASFRMTDKDGALRWLHYKGRIIHNEQGVAIREDGMLSDITARKRVEDEIAVYQKNLRIIFENTQEEILLLDREGRVILFNRAFEIFMTGVNGTPPNVGDYLWETTAEERRATSRKLFEQALAGEVIHTEATFQRHGQVIIHLLRYEPVYINGAITNVCILSTDITRQKENEANLQSVFDSTDDMFTLIDKNLKVMIFNKRSNELMRARGLRELQAGANILDYLPQERAAGFIKALSRVATGEGVSYDSYVDVNGDTRCFHVSITPVRANGQSLLGYCITTHDTTEQKKSEQRIAQNEERFRALVENTEDVIGVADREGNMQYVSPSVTRVTGYAPDEFLALAGPGLVHEDDRLALATFIRNVAEHPRKLYYTEFRSRRKDGSYQWMEGTAINLYHLPGIKGIVTNFRDVTARKMSETDKSVILQRLLEQNDNLMQFSFVASHNLRGPVASILGVLNILQEYDFSDDIDQLLTMIQKSMQRLDEVIKDLTRILEIRREEFTPREWLNVDDATTNVLDNFQLLLRDYDAVITVDSKAVNRFFTIKAYFNSILYNLLLNAIKYRDPSRQLVIDVRTFKDDKNYGFSVRDNGRGIDLKKFSSKLFTLYQRFHLDTEGKGLGLFIVKSQVVALNGKIDVESSPGRGTIFTVTFPLPEDSVAGA